MRTLALVTVAICLSVSCLSCTVRRGTAPASDSEITKLKVGTGDVIRVLTKYREQYTFKITALDSTSMAGETVKLARRDSGSEHEPVKVAYADIALIEVKRKSVARTAGAALVTIEVAGLVALAIVGVPMPIGP